MIPKSWVIYALGSYFLFISKTFTTVFNINMHFTINTIPLYMIMVINWHHIQKLTYNIIQKSTHLLNQRDSTTHLESHIAQWNETVGKSHAARSTGTISIYFAKYSYLCNNERHHLLLYAYSLELIYNAYAKQRNDCGNIRLSKWAFRWLWVSFGYKMFKSSSKLHRRLWNEHKLTRRYSVGSMQRYSRPDSRVHLGMSRQISVLLSWHLSWFNIPQLFINTLIRMKLSKNNPISVVMR